jgi:hypothetical protein
MQGGGFLAIRFALLPTPTVAAAFLLGSSGNAAFGTTRIRDIARSCVIIQPRTRGGISSLSRPRLPLLLQRSTPTSCTRCASHLEAREREGTMDAAASASAEGAGLPGRFKFSHISLLLSLSQLSWPLGLLPPD